MLLCKRRTYRLARTLLNSQRLGPHTASMATVSGATDLLDPNASSKNTLKLENVSGANLYFDLVPDRKIIDREARYSDKY